MKRLNVILGKKQLVAAGLALAFMFTSALCLAAPNDKSDDTLPSVPDVESETEYAAGVGVDYYGHADNAYFSGIGSDMTAKTNELMAGLMKDGTLDKLAKKYQIVLIKDADNK